MATVVGAWEADVSAVAASAATELEEADGRGFFPAGQATAAEAADTASRMDWNFIMTRKMFGV